MDKVFQAIRRFFGQHGEGLLVAATRDLDRVSVALHAAEARIGAEIAKERESIAAFWAEVADREKTSRAALETLVANKNRAGRVAARIAGLVE